jgi:hypothetical protein
MSEQLLATSRPRIRRVVKVRIARESHLIVNKLGFALGTLLGCQRVELPAHFQLLRCSACELVDG